MVLLFLKLTQNELYLGHVDPNHFILVSFLFVKSIFDVLLELFFESLFQNLIINIVKINESKSSILNLLVLQSRTYLLQKLLMSILSVVELAKLDSISKSIPDPVYPIHRFFISNVKSLFSQSSFLILSFQSFTEWN